MNIKQKLGKLSRKILIIILLINFILIVVEHTNLLNIPKTGFMISGTALAFSIFFYVICAEWKMEKESEGVEIDK